MPKILCRKGKRGHKDAEVNLKEGLNEREKQNLIACLKNQYRKIIIINEN